MMYYKILEDGRSCHGGSMEWSLPTRDGDGQWQPGAWHEVEGEIVPCANGLHASFNVYGDWMTWEGTPYEIEFDGEVIEAGDKMVGRRARLLAEVPHEQWWLDVHAFVDGLATIPWFEPDGAPDPEWRLFTAPTWGAAWWAARAAARAAWWAARAATARAAAWWAARAAAGDAARAATETAAEAAELMARVLCCAGTNLDPKHQAFAEAQWRVWQKGYALLCDVDGVLYVYAASG